MKKNIFNFDEEIKNELQETPVNTEASPARKIMRWIPITAAALVIVAVSVIVYPALRNSGDGGLSTENADYAEDTEFAGDTEEPVVTEEPDVTTVIAFATEAPAITEAPEGTEEPEVTEIPVTVEDAVVTEAPEVTTVMVTTVTQAPETTEVMVVSAVLETTETVTVTQAPETKKATKTKKDTAVSTAPETTKAAKTTTKNDKSNEAVEPEKESVNGVYFYDSRTEEIGGAFIDTDGMIEGEIYTLYFKTTLWRDNWSGGIRVRWSEEPGWGPWNDTNNFVWNEDESVTYDSSSSAIYSSDMVERMLGYIPASYFGMVSGGSYDLKITFRYAERSDNPEKCNYIAIVGYAGDQSLTVSSVRIQDVQGVDIINAVNPN